MVRPAYTPWMDLSLDHASEQRIQREIERGHYREPAEVVAHALALLADQEDWLLRDKTVINQRLDESYAQIQLGEGIPGDEVRAILGRDRAARTRIG
jgi:Arc/MetJ-type ribon-helix-helix transcriptional regulator